MILDTTTRKLQIVLTAAKTTTDMPVVVDWVDNTTTTFVPGVTPSLTNGVGLVDILAAPAASTQRKVNGLTINNIDTAAKTVNVFLNDNGTSYQIQSQLLQVGDILCYTDANGWYTKDSNGNIKGFGATGATGVDGRQGPSGIIGYDGSDGEDVWPIPSSFQVAPIVAAGPAFSAYLPTTNQSITSGVITKVSLSAEEFDTTGAFDSATNYRFLPLIAGYYQVNAAVSISGAIGTASAIIIYKNGSAFKEGAGSTSSATAVQLATSAIIYLNGSSDYIELFCSYTGTTPVIVFGANNTYFQGSLLPGVASVGGILPIASGGTNSTTSAAALTALNAAARGANSDITSLTACTSITNLNEPKAATSPVLARDFGFGIWGLTNDVATDSVNDRNINIGGAMDNTGTYFMYLATALGKQTDVAWAVGGTTGTPLGGLDTGAVGNNDYYIWLIARSDTGVVDALYSLSSTAPTMPTNYDKKRLIGWLKRVGATIVQYHTYETGGGGIGLLWDVPTLDVNLANTLTTSRRTDAVKVPLNFSVIANLNIVTADASAAHNDWVYCPDQTDAVPSSAAAPLITLSGLAGANTGGNYNIRTSSTGTIAARSTLATVDSYFVSTMGFTWDRRN